MDKVRRVLVHVCKDQSAPQRAQFVQSVTGHFSDGGDDEVEVSCSLERKQFVLFRGDGRRGTPLKRPAFCPIKHLSVSQSAAIPLDVQRRGVDVGVAIILQTANRRVLLTPKILGLWESVYPPMLSRGLPQRHHIVVYMLLLSRLSHLQLQASLRPSPAEVSACLWADRQLVGAVVSSVDAEDGHVPLHHLQGSVSVSQVFSDGALSEAALPLEVLLGRAPACGPDVERVSTGTKFALELWLKSLEDLRPLTPPEKML
uniref:nucleoside diphosphate-linked moiety X motif 17 isoform X3 n=1 Tax=Gasterosteus aculeatus aculeatus TaxID=481459 RepID=UPI001A999191|nr:nucleoside diphosphate-linked moiety X motif 17 isoform X3 [Gasterosteus aculeatus aculeatus]